MKPLRFLVLAVLAAGALSVSSCSLSPVRPTPSAGDLSGTWTNNDARLDLRPGGTFELTDVPVYTDPTGDEDWEGGNADVRNEVGTWTVDDFGVNLFDERPDGATVRMGFRRDGTAGLVLYFAIDLAGLPRCYEMAKAGSTYKPRLPADCYLMS